MVRYTDPSNYYYVSLRTSNELSLRKVVNGVITELDRLPFTIQLNQRYRVRIEAIGTKLVVYVNDQAGSRRPMRRTRRGTPAWSRTGPRLRSAVL